ncbi:hypothetical protein [Anatilimnocola floriformis]|uniref:hypothetical protein n=1 Tax=Anatilimnocola floriformis TaxID=2948575 RepID=UPI0020C30AA1|nr:hypothetical protein [Anatilimnocola floriformis]
MSSDINVLALVKGEERYIFLFDDERRAEALRTLGRFASNPELSFSWYDAAVLSQRIRSTVPENEQAAEQSHESQNDAIEKRHPGVLPGASGSSAVPRPHSRPRFNFPVADSASELADDEL